MKHLKTLLIVGALAILVLGFAAIVSAQDATGTPIPEATAEPEATPVPDADADSDEAAPTPYIGITFEGTDGGVTVIDVVADSPAEAAGLEAGDVITAINGTAVTEDTLRDTVLGFAVGDTVTVDVLRGDETLSLEVTLGEAPQTFRVVRPGRQDRPDVQIFRTDRPRLGITIADQDAGVVVTEVAEGSPAEAAGILVDDIITAVNGTTVASAEEAANAVAEAVDAAEVGEFTVTVTVTRGDETLELTGTLEKSEMPRLPEIVIPNRRDNRDRDRDDNDSRSFSFGLPGFTIVPRDGEGGGFDVVVPFTPANPEAMTQDVTDAMAEVGIIVTPRDGEEGVFDLTIPADALGGGTLGSFSLPKSFNFNFDLESLFDLDLESLLPEGFSFNGPLGRGFRFEIPSFRGRPTQPRAAGEGKL